MSRADEAGPGLEDAAILFDAFRRSSLRQMELRFGAFTLGLSREGALRPVVDGEATPAAEVLRAPHVATLAWLAAAGDLVPAGEAYARLEVLGAETPLVRAVETRVLAVRAALGDLVEFDAPMLEVA